MNGDFELATKLIEVFRHEARRVHDREGYTIVASSFHRIADSIQQLLDEHNPKKKEQDRDL